MNRRQFIQTATMAVSATATLGLTRAFAADAGPGVNWPIGCFNRPWVKEGYRMDTALDGIQGAGYKIVGLLTRTKEEPFIGSDATPKYLQSLKVKAATHGLRPNMGALRTGKNDMSAKEWIKDIRIQIDNAKMLDVEYLLTFGVDDPGMYPKYYQTMADAAAYSQDKGLKLVLKPHGGGSGASEEIIRCISKVNHPNFKIWYDAGNIIYYTGKDPMEQLKPIIQHVTGFCAKDCNEEKGNVWLELGKGKVDFKGIFTELKKAGFNGPVMVECCARSGGAENTPTEETNASVHRNLEFLQKMFATI